LIRKHNKNKARYRRHRRVRGKVKGIAQCPRLNVFRSLKNIHAQLIDDVSGTTLVSASSVEKDFVVSGGNKAGAREVGKIIGLRAIKEGFRTVVFDRGGYLFHGRVKELANGARESGLEF
jgi:large subunit ribosomal protein L18